MASLKFKNIKVGEEIIFFPLRIVSGLYGPQPIVAYGGKEVYLPSHVDLVEKIKIFGFDTQLSAKRKTAGNKRSKARYVVERANRVKGQQTL